MNRLPAGYVLRLKTPLIDDFLRLRRETGLTPRDEPAALAGLPNTLVGVVVEHGGEAVGMGRVIGDGGLFYQVVDIAILPSHQGHGLGKAVMAALMERLAGIVPGRAYVSLMADGTAQHLYRQYGFEPVAPKSVGMAMWLDPSA